MPSCSMALSELVRQAAKETPVVIVLEDLHWRTR
jgi:predicted ATPase